MEQTEFAKKIDELYQVILRLRGREGCPWDQKQSPETIKKYLLEEAGELAEALSTNNTQNVCEEIGDLFFILLLILRIYEENDHFTPQDTLSGIIRKMIRRHPHVFAGKTPGNEEDLKKQWQAIKEQEKK